MIRAWQVARGPPLGLLGLGRVCWGGGLPRLGPYRNPGCWVRCLSSAGSCAVRPGVGLGLEAVLSFVTWGQRSRESGHVSQAHGVWVSWGDQNW